VRGEKKKAYADGQAIGIGLKRKKKKKIEPST
jgi:hypothetical protein